MTSKRTATAIRFPDDLLAQLHEAAREREVSINWLVNRAVREFLPRLIPVGEIAWTRDLVVTVERHVETEGTQP